MRRFHHRREIMTFDDRAGEVKLHPEPSVVTKAHWVTVKCKFCGADKLFLHGYTKKGTQRYLCLTCKRTFIDNKAPPSMQFSSEVIATALNLFYGGMSLAKIQEHLRLAYDVKPNRMTIHRWVTRYSKKATKVLGDVPVKVGSTWVADETTLKLKEARRSGSSKIWFHDLIDKKSRFLLGSHLSDTRSTADAQILMEKAAKRANKAPKTVITDKLSTYPDGVELTFGSETKHIRAKKLTAEPGTQTIERFHGSLKERMKVMRSLTKRGTAKTIIDGWLSHYNFFRPHQSLGGRTPAEAAGADAPFKNWKDVVEDKDVLP